MSRLAGLRQFRDGFVLLGEFFRLNGGENDSRCSLNHFKAFGQKRGIAWYIWM